MKQLNRKIEITLFVFLGIFALLVNAIAFYILADYNSRHYIALAKSHMEQQYQNSQQRMAVLGEQIRMLGDNAQFTGEIARGDWSTVIKKLDEFRQSSGNIASLSIYTLKDGKLVYARGDSDMRYPTMPTEDITDIWEKSGSQEQNAVWFLQKIDRTNTKCLSYLMPIYDKEEELGFLLADVNAENFMGDILKENGELQWTESVDIASEEESRQWTEEEGETFRIQNGNIIAVRTLAQSRIVLVQMVSLKLTEMLLPVGAALVCIFLVSLVCIYLGVKVISKSIMIPLKELKRKMDTTLEQ